MPTDTARPASPSAQQIETASQRLQALERQLAQAVVGQQAVIRELIVALTAAGHVLIEGLPGVGKTLLVRALARAVGGVFARIQFTPDLMPSDITGHALFDLKSERFVIRRGPIFCNLLLGDEINRAPAKTQSALLEAMQEQQVTIEGDAHPLQPPFLVLATQNPIEQEGTYPLPQAQLDRFLIKSFISAPAAADEVALVRQVTAGAVADQLDLSRVEPVLDPAMVLALQATSATLLIDDAVLDYAVRLVRSTRSWPGIEAGAGPRAAIALVRAARAHALLAGRGFVTPADVKVMVHPVLRHRLRLGADLEIEGIGTDAVLSDLLAAEAAPRA